MSIDAAIQSEKQLALEALSRMPESVTLDQISEEIAILAAIRRGEAAADAGQVVPHGKVAQEVGGMDFQIAWTEAEATMETETMGKVVVTAHLENLEDVYKAAHAALPADQVRTVEVMDALIDTGTTGLLVPRRLIAQLGLLPLRAQARGRSGAKSKLPCIGPSASRSRAATASATWGKSRTSSRS